MNQSRFGVPPGLRLEGRSGSSGDGYEKRSIWNMAPTPDSLPCLRLFLKTDRTTQEGSEIRGESVGVNSGAQCYCESIVPHTCASRLHFRLVLALLETLQTCALPTWSAGLTEAGSVSPSALCSPDAPGWGWLLLQLWQSLCFPGAALSIRADMQKNEISKANNKRSL